MLDSVERRCKAYQLSNSLKSLNDDCKTDLNGGEKENLTTMNSQFHSFHQIVSVAGFFLFSVLKKKLFFCSISTAFNI